MYWGLHIFKCVSRKLVWLFPVGFDHLFNRQSLQKLLLFCPSDNFFKWPSIIWTYISLILNYSHFGTVWAGSSGGEASEVERALPAHSSAEPPPIPQTPFGTPGLPFFQASLFFFSSQNMSQGVSFLRPGWVVVCLCRWRRGHRWAQSADPAPFSPQLSGETPVLRDWGKSTASQSILLRCLRRRNEVVCKLVLPPTKPALALEHAI